MSSKTWLVTLAGLGCLAFGWYALPDRQPGAVAPVADPSTPTVPPPPAAQQAAAPPAPGPASQQLRMPDGSEIAPLNGVKNPPPALWGDSRPYAPIVRISRTTIDWYVHADGSLTTTLEVYRKDLGRKDAVTMVCNPTDTAPLEIDGKIIPLPERSASGR